MSGGLKLVSGMNVLLLVCFGRAVRDLLIMRLWEVPTEKCGCLLKACAETEYDGY